MHRLFVALRPPEEARDLLIDAMDGAELRWQDDDQLHLTLRFVGEVERPMADDLAASLENVDFRRFSLRISGVGRFDHGRRGAVWAGVAPKEELRALAAKIERACQSCGLEPERRAYHPHITLARWNNTRPAVDRWLTEHGSLISDPWDVREFILYESRLGREGAHYEEILSVPLRDNATIG